MPTFDPAELIAVELSPEERSFLTAGVEIWLGPAYPSPEQIIAFGFRDRDSMVAGIERLLGLMANYLPMSRLQWTQAEMLAEIGFASDVQGAGVEWRLTTDIDDQQAIATLRRIQLRLLDIRLRPDQQSEGLGRL